MKNRSQSEHSQFQLLLFVKIGIRLTNDFISKIISNLQHHELKNMILDFLQKNIGFFAAFCTTFAFFPQAIKVWKSKSTKDISLGMFMIFTIGVISWLIYGIIINNLPVIFANSVTLFLSLFILVFKLKYK